MKNSLNNKTFAQHIQILLLARNEDFAAIDRQTLRTIHIKNIQFMESGIKAASNLANKFLHQQKQPDCIICHEQLKDMTGEAFINILQLHPTLSRIPIVMTVPSNTPENQQATYATLQRPYSPTRLLQTIHTAKNKVMAVPETTSTSTVAFESALDYLQQEKKDTKNTLYEDAYKKGLQAIRNKDWDEAIHQLTFIVTRQPEHTNALLLLATAWKGKGNQKKYTNNLRILLHCYVTSHQWKQAQTINNSLIKSMGKNFNPLYNEAYEFLCLGNISNAAQAIIFGYTPSQDVLMYEKLSLGCLATSDPQDTAKKLQEYFKTTGNTTLAEKLAEHLLKHIEKQKQLTKTSQKKKNSTSSFEANNNLLFILDAKKQPSQKKETKIEQTEDIHMDLMHKLEPTKLLKSFPTLQDALAVFKFTYYMFQKSKK